MQEAVALNKTYLPNFLSSGTCLSVTQRYQQKRACMHVRDLSTKLALSRLFSFSKMNSVFLTKLIKILF